MKIGVAPKMPQHRGRLFALLLCLLLLAILSHRYSVNPSKPASLSSSAWARFDLLHKSYGSDGSALNEPSFKILQFWEQLHDALAETRPKAGDVNVVEEAKSPELDPSQSNAENYRRPDHVQMSEDDLDALRHAHADFVKLARQLAPSLTYRKRTRGIVMTAAESYVGIAITSLMMLRQTGTKLPVQLFVDKMGDQDKVDCANIVRALGAECVSMEGLWKATPSMARVEKFQFKILSIVFSTFQHVLFFDADCWPLKDPEPLFDNEPYASNGLVTWQDFWFSTVSSQFYDIAQLDPSARERQRTSESGIIMYDKARHASSLLLAVYYNYYGPEHYYRLLSQGGHGEGDKETFLHSAMVMGNPFYEVQTRVGRLGRWINGSFDQVGMRQADPHADFEELAAYERRHPSNKQSDGGSNGKNLMRPEMVQAPWMFMHQNAVKLDMRRISDLLDVLLKRDAAFGLQRLWGDDRALRQAVGHDPEKELWQAILETNCGTSLLDACVQIRKWFETVFRN